MHRGSLVCVAAPCLMTHHPPLGGGGDGWTPTHHGAAQRKSPSAPSVLKKNFDLKMGEKKGEPKTSENFRNLVGGVGTIDPRPTTQEYHAFP